MVVLLSCFSGPFCLPKLRRFHLLQIPYSYSMEPYYVIPSQGFAAVMCAAHASLSHTTPTCNALYQQLTARPGTTSACAAGVATSSLTRLSSRLSPLNFLWFLLLASFTSRTRVSNLGRRIGGSCTSMPSVIAEVSIDFDFVAQVPFRRVYNH